MGCISGHRVLATLDLALAETGAAVWPLQVGMRSLLLRFSGGEGRASAVTLGAVITPRSAVTFVPGETVVALVLFWADEARICATPGGSFELWYGSRIVGHGTVIGEAAEAAERT
jgi:hypothetical protein